MASIIKKPRLRAVPMGLYPSMNDLNEVINLAQETLGGDKSSIYSLFMTYHNTMLKELHQ